MGCFAAALIAGGLLGVICEMVVSREPAPLEISRATATGEWLRVGQLAAGECMIVTHLSPGDRDSRVWTYQIEGGEALRLVVTEHAPTWDKDHVLRAGKILSSEARVLAGDEVAALEIFWRAIQIPAQTHRTYEDTYEVEYLRHGQAVGREMFVDDAPGTMEQEWWNYEELSPTRKTALTKEQWLAARSFRSLIKKGALPPLETAGPTGTLSR